MKKPVFVVIGILLALLGVFWLLQGLNVFNQSGGMNGKHAFIYVGIVVALAGIGLVVTGARRRSTTPSA